MSSKKAMKQAQKQSYAKHRSNITNSRFNLKKKILPKINENNFLKSAEGVEEIQPSLGWRPIYRLISEPPIFVPDGNITSKVEEIVESHIVVNVIQSDSQPAQVIDRPPDRSEGNIPKLIKLISHQSRLENREVVRRAQRKRRSLGPVTLWMALALVAREQGLDMDKIIKILEK